MATFSFTWQYLQLDKVERLRRQVRMFLLKELRRITRKLLVKTSTFDNTSRAAMLDNQTTHVPTAYVAELKLDFSRARARGRGGGEGGGCVVTACMS